MKRFLTAALLLGSFSVFTLVGCSEETKTVDKSTTETPGGSQTKTTETKVDSTGDMKSGEANKSAETPK